MRPHLKRCWKKLNGIDTEQALIQNALIAWSILATKRLPSMTH